MMSVSDQEWQEMQLQQQIEEQYRMEQLRVEQERLTEEKAKASIPPPVLKRKHGKLTAADKAAYRARQEWEQSEKGRQEMEQQKKLEDEENQGKSNQFLDKPLVWVLAVCLLLILFLKAPVI